MSLAQSRNWVSNNGTILPSIRNEMTPSQLALLETPTFQIQLGLYKRAVERGMVTAVHRLELLNKDLQEAYMKDAVIAEANVPVPMG